MSKLVATVICLVPASAWAHPGHGTLDPTAVRHGVVVLVAVVAAVAAWGWSKSRATTRAK